MAKKELYCGICDNIIQVYKKGKAKKVYVCPVHGIIMHNPVPWGSVAKRVAKGALGEIPGASLVMEGLGLAGDLMGSKKPKGTIPTQPHKTNDLTRSDKIINQVMHDERIY